LEKEQLKYLIKKYQQNELTAAELRLLQDFTQEDHYMALFEEVAEELYLEQENIEIGIDSENLYRNISQEIYLRKREPKLIRNQVVLLVASVAALALIVFYFVKKQNSIESQQLATTTNQMMPILPGGAKARLVLENGEEVDLASLATDTTLQLAGYKIHKNAQGELKYSLDNSVSEGLYNTIVTPKGGEYNLNLPDGSRIFVNASSRIRYPLKFAKNKREIELDGEAYFEVKRMIQGNQTIPFIVKTREQTLTVLGTSFNINCYHEAIETTLVEGKVQLNYPNERHSLLSPNQQARYVAKKDLLDIKEIDPFYTIAWKNGTFAFENATLNTVMSDLARWYDVEIDYRGNVSNIRFSGTISKYENIEKVLKAIELTGTVKFKIQERRIIVMS